MKLFFVYFKSFLKKFSFLERCSRGIFSKLPLSLREKFANYTQNPYSDIELKNGVIFVHIPKCAGNAVMKSLFDTKGQGHNTLKQYYMFDRAKFEKSYIFSVMREPVARFESAFTYLMAGGMGLYDLEFRDKVLSKFSDINTFVENLKFDKDLKITVLEWTHFKPQVTFLELNNTYEMLDRIILQESLSDGIQLVCKDLGIDLVDLKKINVTPVKKSELTDQNKEFVRLLYSEDVELYEKLSSN
jgi:chondroitin 4-sulfotransferase 11